MDWSEILVICVCVVLLLVFVGWFVLSIVKTSKKKKDDVEVINGTRYSKDDSSTQENGNANVTLNKGDIMLERGKEYLVGKDLMPGKYTILTGDENVDEINIRIGGIVKSYKHDTSVVLTKGDKISAVSANVVLR